MFYCSNPVSHTIFCNYLDCGVIHHSKAIGCASTFKQNKGWSLVTQTEHFNWFKVSSALTFEQNKDWSPVTQTEHFNWFKFSSVQSGSRWNLRVQKSPYVLHPISQKLPPKCLWNSSVCLLLMMALSCSFKEDHQRPIVLWVMLVGWWKFTASWSTCWQ